jgi:hypothetical protein
MGMKTIWEGIVMFFEDLGRAKAAAALAREGRYDAARQLFEKDWEVHP